MSRKVPSNCISMSFWRNSLHGACGLCSCHTERSVFAGDDTSSAPVSYHCAWTPNNGQGYRRFLPFATPATTDDADGACHRQQASLISSDCISDDQEDVRLQHYRCKCLSAFDIPSDGTGRNSFVVNPANRWSTTAAV